MNITDSQRATLRSRLTKNHSMALHRSDRVNRVLACSIERFARSNLNRHADVLPIICGRVLRCYRRCFINGIRLNDNECASQLGDIQQRTITDHWRTIDRPYRLPFLIRCQRTLHHHLAGGAQDRVMRLTGRTNRIKFFLRKWCVQVVLASLWRLEKAGQMSRSFAD